MTRGMQSLELILDDDADAAIRGLWTRMAEAGLPSQASHPGASNRPHITVLVRETLAPPREDPSPLPLALTLGPLIVLGRDPRWILARSVVPSAALLALHARLHDAAGPGEDAPFGSPGTWTPHVTLGRRLSPAAVAQALALPDLAEPLTASAVGLRHWDGVAKVETRVG